MKKLLHFVVGCICFAATSSNILGQGKPPIDIPKVVPATPNATKITDFYALRPNLYTGTANVSIPLYTIEFDGWKIPLSISYNATGVRVNEEASEIGLGWALSANGLISRQINGADDFFDGGIEGFGKGYVVGDKELAPHMDFIDAREGGTSPKVPDPTTLYYHLATKRIDTQPDVFNYNFFGYSGSFVLTRQIRGEIKVVKITQDACLITFNSRQRIFTVTTPEGFKGTFDVFERTSTITSGSVVLTEARVFECCQMSNVDVEYLKGSSGQFRTITSWYLSKIVSPRRKTLNFTYDLLQGRSHNISSTRSFAERTEANLGTKVCIQTIQEHAYLVSISGDEVQVTLQMIGDRDDLRRNTMLLAGGESDPLSFNNFPASAKLKRYSGLIINGLKGSTLNKTIRFQQSYFNLNRYNAGSDTEEELEYLRLKLDRVTIDDQVYSFYYEKPDYLPSKFSSGMDHFGFANGDIRIPVGDLLPPRVVSNVIFNYSNLEDTVKPEQYSVRAGRQVNLDYGKAGVLSKVVYPTGGYTKFTYESHTYSPEPSLFSELSPTGFLAGGTRIRSIEEFDYDDVLKRAKEYYYVEDPAAPVPVSTGKMMTPLYNRYARIYYAGGDTTFEMKRRSFSGIPGSHAAQGKVIGYSKVHEKVKGTATEAYWNTYTFVNNTNYIQAFAAVAAGTPNVNGQIKETFNYNSGNKLVQTIVNSDYEHVLKGKILGLMYEPQPGNVFLEYYVPYYLERTFIQPSVVTTTTFTTPGSNTSQVVLTTSYNDSTRLLTSQKMLNSLGEEIKTIYKRPFDYPTPSPLIDSMKMARIIEPVIEEITYNGSQVISAHAKKYQMVTAGQSSFANLKKIYNWNPALGSFMGSNDGSNFSPPYELRVSFDEYDNEGNVRQYTAADGLVNSFIWHPVYNRPIVHGINVSYAQLKDAHDASLGNEAAIRNHANTMGKMITTYKHDPLVGIVEITSPSNLKTTFNYDKYKRLKAIVDNDGKTIEQYEMNYRKVAPVYSATVSTDKLDWGVQIPNPQDPIRLFGTNYPGCTSAFRSFTITNNGTDDLNVRTYLASGGGFRPDFQSGRLMPGASIPINVKINPDRVSQTGPQNAVWAIEFKRASDNALVDTRYVTMHGELQEISCPPSTVEVDIGTTVQVNKSVVFNIPASSNAGFRVYDYSWVSNGSYTNPQFLWDFSVSQQENPTECVMPGATATNPKLVLNYHSPAVQQTRSTSTLLLRTTLGCDITVTVRGWRRESDYWRHMTIEFPNGNLKLEPVMQTSGMTRSIRLVNDGENPLSISDISKNRNDASFSISETSFTIQPGESKDVTVTFNPGLYDLTDHSITYTLVERSGSFSGTSQFTVTGKRKTYRAVEISPKELAINGNDLGIFYVKNVGNASLTVAGVKYATTSGGTYSTSSTAWSTEIISPATIAPLGTVQMRVHKANEMYSQVIQVQYAKTDGLLNANDEILVQPVNRNITLSNASFGNFVNGTGSDYSQLVRTMTVANNGNSFVTIDGISSSNTAKFVVQLPSNVSLPYQLKAGSSFDITVTYTDNDFAQYSANIVVNSPNVTVAGSVCSRTVTAYREKTLRYTLSKSLINLKYSNQGSDREVQVVNTGNVPINLGFGISPADRSEYNATINNTQNPIGILQTRTIAVQPTLSGDFNGPPGVLSILGAEPNGSWSSTQVVTLSKGGN